MKCFALALVVLLFHQKWPKALALSFDNPYFLILEAEPDGQNVLIQTDTCTSGGYSNVAISIKKFCATGFWILISEWCGNENGQKYFVAARDSCFEIPKNTEIKVKRFMPILQKLTDFDGHAFAWKDDAAYFVRLNDTDKTPLRPIDGPNKDWNIMTVNQKFYGRYIHETALLETNVSRQCYSSENYPEVFQFYKLFAGGDRPTDSIFEPVKGIRQCRSGYTVKTRESGRMTGVIYWNSGSEIPSLNSTSSFIHMQLEVIQVVVPGIGARQSVQCADDGRGSRLYNPVMVQPKAQKYPKFPHQFPTTDAEKMITDEIQETTLKYMEHQLHGVPIPPVKRTEYELVRKSSKILQKFCCHPKFSDKTWASFRLLFRLSLLYYHDYFAYSELEDPEQDSRITTALETCVNKQTQPAPNECIRINGTNDCYDTINYTTWKTIDYPYDMPEELEYEEGNIDYILETAWKAMLFVHYFCAEYFADPSDHSAFTVKVESFINPVMRTKWNRPQKAHRVYQLLLSDTNLKKFGEVIDACVYTAHQVSPYVRWLSRPDIELTSRRKKRDVDAGCVPKNVPKVFCLEKQFDMIDHNLVHPKVTSGECYNSYQNRAKYKYIHASKFRTSYS